MKKLADLKNVGKAALEDLAVLEIKSVKELACQDPTALFHKLEELTCNKHDFCVWDVFAAIIHEAKTGDATNWWDWTQGRKELQKKGALEHFN